MPDHSCGSSGDCVKSNASAVTTINNQVQPMKCCLKFHSSTEEISKANSGVGVVLNPM